MTRLSRRADVRHSLLLALVCVLLTGCVGMPDQGPVTESRVEPQEEGPPAVSFDPRPPQSGETPSEIVSGFLEAMKATPVRTSVARQFLSTSARKSWAPEQRVLTYQEATTPPNGGTTMNVDLTGVDVYDERGAWRRNVPSRSLAFSVVQEEGEWRLSTVPDALVVPDDWFADWYQPMSTYYFDPAAEILVPEPVFVPRGDQLASFLVRSLLAAPDPATSGTLRTFFPPGMSDGLSVPISQAGVAEVSLSGDPALVEEAGSEQMLAQLVWTLRQIPRVRAVELRIGGEMFADPDGRQQIGLDVGSEYSPTSALANQHVFGLQSGRLVRGELADLEATAGPLGSRDLRVAQVSVNLAGSRVAAVGADGSTLLLAPVEQGDGAVEQVVSGADRLQVAGWDHRDRIWLLDRNGGAARVLLTRGEEVREVQVRGISGRDVSHLLVSRDSTRLVAVVAAERADRMVVARVQQEGNGRVIGGGHPRSLVLAAEGPGGVEDVAWRSPTTVSLLSAITDDLAQVRTVSVDTSRAEVQTGGVSRVRGAPRQLVGTPVESKTVYAVGGRTITDLTRPERRMSLLPRGLTALTYVG